MITGDRRPAATNPFPLPGELGSDLARTLDYWKGLPRAEARIPFWDDLKLSALGDVAARTLVIEVFDKPQRFRLDIVGEEIDRATGGSLKGAFPDKVTRPPHPLDFLLAQASATVEAGAPTWYRNAVTDEADGGAYARLMVPMWGDGRIGIILAAVEKG